MVNKTDVLIFSSANWKDAKSAYESWKKSVVTPERGTMLIAAYFNEDEDTYKMTKIAFGREPVEHSVYSWDELSRIVYEAI